eukprot:CAMPEP_0197684262 /NCGR_PEP_ID=MMETSP1338-20131121/99255_1 /TAXON_ID=43686 ORGANISM="Pelagodinium beii, Strain RCC1491" /NCGR_SAMPLE_ID=MMETSP1338 /ASSEMBLY_ACC=CAM_ASM_000754 /LENGTH=57 /DNA_ID=CAMNT_0043265955 /DNA_START=185 /DNA_END=358 /DNA_ORIENTATION=+
MNACAMAAASSGLDGLGVLHLPQTSFLAKQIALHLGQFQSPGCPVGDTMASAVDEEA